MPSLSGCISESDTYEEAIKNIKEAIKLYLEPDEDEFFEYRSAKIDEVVV